MVRRSVSGSFSEKKATRLARRGFDAKPPRGSIKAASAARGIASPGRFVPLAAVEAGLLFHEVEDAQEEFGRLGARYDILLIEDEAGHALDAHAARDAILGPDLGRALPALHVVREWAALEAGRGADIQQRQAVADVAAVEEVGLEQPFDQLVLRP